METWASRRKAIYLGFGFALLFIFILVPTFFFLYEKPTCFDEEKNGDETGVDCGGKCQLLCSFEALEPTILWSRAFKVTDGVYSAVAYIENPNVSSETLAPYVFKLYDSQNKLIGIKENRTYLPKNGVIAIFEPNINTDTQVPARVIFEFTDALQWQKNDVMPPQLALEQSFLTNETSRPRVDATVKNNSREAVENIELVGIVYDDNENAIAASRTFVDRLDIDEQSKVTFTWPKPFATTTEICRVPIEGVVGDRSEALGVMLAIDRSGSMKSLGSNPPQPLTGVKNAVTTFIQELRGTDQVGVLSFASTSTQPVESPLTLNYASATAAVQMISIQSDGVQNTNIADGIEKAYAELLKPTQNVLTNRAIILLTDGEATVPTRPGDPKYPELFAKERAQIAKDAGVELFTIGLGGEVNKDFLRDISTSPAHFYAASSTADLAGIYDKIAVSFCTTGPSVVEIIPRVIPSRF